MFVRIWRYRVEERDRDSFELAYRADGDWARLFSLGDGYLGTDLLRGAPGTYVTIDRWRGEADWRLFLDEHGEAYRALDRQCEALTASEEEIGEFSPLA